jgi:hypothetical protein
MMKERKGGQDARTSTYLLHEQSSFPAHPAPRDMFAKSRRKSRPHTRAHDSNTTKNHHIPEKLKNGKLKKLPSAGVGYFSRTLTSMLAKHFN